MNKLTGSCGGERPLTLKMIIVDSSSPNSKKKESEKDKYGRFSSQSACQYFRISSKPARTLSLAPTLVVDAHRDLKIWVRASRAVSSEWILLKILPFLDAEPTLETYWMTFQSVPKIHWAEVKTSTRWIHIWNEIIDPITMTCLRRSFHRDGSHFAANFGSFWSHFESHFFKNELENWDQNVSKMFIFGKMDPVNVVHHSKFEVE